MRAADETVDAPDGDGNFGRVLIEGAVRGQRLDLEPAGREARVGHVAVSVRQSVTISDTQRDAEIIKVYHSQLYSIQSPSGSISAPVDRAQREHCGRLLPRCGAQAG